MVQISSLVTLFAMGSSVLASPVVAVSAVAMSPQVSAIPDQGLALRADEDGRVTGIAPFTDGVELDQKGGDAADAIATAVLHILDLVEGILDQQERRKAFTQQVAREVHTRLPGYNVVVCNVGYSLTGSGFQRVSGTSFKAKFGANVSFDVIIFNSPKTFVRRGDGGFQNWAYIVGSNCQTNGATINCPAHR